MPERTETTTIGRGAIGAAVVFLLSCSVFWATTQVIRLPPAWYTFEFCQYAEIGMNLAVEGRFDTRLVEPMALAYIDAHRVGPPGPRWPVLNRYPWPCLIIAALMKAFGPTEIAAAWSNGLAVSGLAALAYLLARRWYGRGWAALVAALILANPAFYGQFILLGTPDVWFALVFLLELLAWCRLDERPEETPRRRAALAIATGALAGLAYLTRFNVAAFLAPQVAVLLWRRRWVETACLIGAATVVASPMAAYNLRHLGRPFVGIYSAWNLLDGIGAYHTEPWLYYRVPDLAAELRGHLGGLARKLATNLGWVIPTRIWSLWHLDALLVLAALGVATGRKGSTTPGRRCLLWAAGLFAWQLLLFSGLRLELEDRASPHHGRYFFWFAVPALLLGVGTLRRLAARSRWWHVLTALVLIGQLALFSSTWSHWVADHRRGTNLGRDPIRKMLARVVAEGQTVASNQPQMVAWFCRRRAISLPADPVELARLNRDSPTPADYLFIDLNFNAIQLDNRWAHLVEGISAEAPGWEPALLEDYRYVLPPRGTRPVKYVLLRRRAIPPSAFERLHAPRDAGGAPSARP